MDTEKILETYDLFVYGSTPGGIAAAVEASRRGLKVLLACPKNNPGGMAASGLCTTDAVRRVLFGAFVLEFIEGVKQHYLETIGNIESEWELCKEGWFYEPSVAEMVFRKIIENEKNIEWLPGNRLTDVSVDSNCIGIIEITNLKNEVLKVSSTTYIDATYEGDLAAQAGVPYNVGREGKDEFGESFAGIHYMNWRTGKEIKTKQSGEPSIAIQAYCARSILTNDSSKMIQIDMPDSYEQHLQDYVPILQDIKNGRIKKFGDVVHVRRMPNNRFEVNGGIEDLTSTNCPGISWGYPESDYETRQYLDRFHIEHIAGMIWFLQTEKQIPDSIRNEAKSFGLHVDEFKENGHWPWQIYVRQGRRIKGREILTQNSFTVDSKTGCTPLVENSIALGEHSFDVHPCHDRRFAIDGFMEGVLWYPKKAMGPAQPGQVPYGAMVPENIDNLLVPVALSSTHIAMSVLRMEPLWMTTGQVAGLAAVKAKETGYSVSNIESGNLANELKIETNPLNWIKRK